MNPGRRCQVVRGARVIWDGKLMEPAETAGGWQITAVGVGKAGAGFAAGFLSWTNQKDALDQAIGPGLRGVEPGIPPRGGTGRGSRPGRPMIQRALYPFSA